MSRAGLCLFAVGLLAIAHARTPTLRAAFTPVPISADASGSAWDRAVPAEIGIISQRGAQIKVDNPQVKATAAALWHGSTLYLRVNVVDPQVTARSGVQFFIDQFDDKFPKFEEDDGTITIGADGKLTGNRTNAGLRYFPTVWSSHLIEYKVAPFPHGYTVTIAWEIGDRPLKNGTKIGLEIAVHAADVTPGAAAFSQELHWSSAQNRGLDDNTMWGDIVLAGYDGRTPMPPNTFMLRQHIAAATPADSSDAGLVRGIWKDEGRLDRALAQAKTALSVGEQSKIDRADRVLADAIRGLRRAGKYPDPYDLRPGNYLPDPFRFLDGHRVLTPPEWDKRREEIKDLAQYYEFGAMPGAPQSLTAASSGDSVRTISIAVGDRGRTSSFKPVLYLPTSGTAPYPVIVEESFRSNFPPNKAYLQGGYAVLSIPTTDAPGFGASGVASDDGNHTGAFYTLYPYRLDREGDDRGVLLAWAWGASRGVDALEYLVRHDPAYTHLLDLKKLVVTGFSRWGKAALLAGFLDDRFQVTAPGGSGSGGAAPYRYDSFGNVPFRHAPFGNVYPWGQSPGAESFGDHVRHQTHNSNEMIRRFLNEPRMYQTKTWGYADRLPYDHHEIIAAIAPRAVLIDNTNDDYADNAEGDSIGFEGAMPVFAFLGVRDRLALDLFMGGGGHSLKPSQAENLVAFSNFVLFGKPLSDAVRKQLSSDPYLSAGTYDRYYGGLETMMPWAAHRPHPK